MPKIVDYEKRRKEIARAAVGVFVASGYGIANLADIAAKLGLGRTTIYKYFRNKEEILEFAVEGMFQRLLHKMQAPALAALQPEERLVALFEVMIEDGLANRDDMLLLLNLLFRVEGGDSAWSATARERIAALKASFEGVLSEGLASGVFRHMAPSDMAHVIVSLIEMFILQSAYFDSFPREGAIRASKLLLSGLLAKR